jgi:enoyl-CoA hydratase
MGVNEIKLGIPVPYPSDRILNQIIGPHNAQEMMYTGEFYTPEHLKEMGLVDAILPESNVVSEAKEKIQSIGEMPQRAFELIKRNHTEYVVKQILDKLEEKEKYFLERWQSSEVKLLIKEAVKKF